MIVACSADQPAAVPALVANGQQASGSVLRWSDRNSWPTHTVPTAGQDVTIPDSTTILLDVATPALGSVTINGRLVADTGTVALNAARVDVYGELDAGTADQPYTGRLTITLLERPGDQASDTKGIVVHGGGQLELHGRQRVMWTHLAADAQAGAQQLQLAEPVDWHAGDRIVVAPSGFDYHETDLATVQSGATNSVTLTQPLQYSHTGTIQQVGGVSVDERAEVGLLSHDILIQGDSLSETNGHGGHLMILYGGSAHVEGIELYRMGQRGQMGRYPFHWHLAGSVPGQYIRNSSVWHTFNRCTTIHGTNDALVEDNVCYDHAGHGYFIEDGIETGNTLKDNLAMYARPGSLLPSDDTPASFWITNPDNTFEGNVAAGASIGFWFTPPMHPTGPSATDKVWPAFTPIRRFDGNVAHSSNDGIHMEEDHREGAPGFDPGYFPRSDATPRGTPVMSVVSHYTAYENRRAFWVRGDHQRIDSSVLADNSIGVMMGGASLDVEGQLLNSLVVGQTGNPHDQWGRQSGVLLYDGPVTISHVTFVNFQHTSEDAAIGGQDNRLWIRVSPRFAADHVSLVNARAVYLPTQADDHYGFASVRDVDGTLTGTAGSQVIPALSFLSDPSCTAQPEWNASVCQAPYMAVGIGGAYDLTGTVLSKDGATLHTWSGTNGPNMSFTLPANHMYEFAPPNLTTTYSLHVDGLTGSNSVTLVGPWQSATAHVVARGVTSADTLSLVNSLAELKASAASAVYTDTTARKVYVRVVGPVKDPVVQLFLQP